jgi:preprotein translocase subunit SecD
MQRRLILAAVCALFAVRLRAASDKPVALSVHLLVACSPAATVKVKVGGGAQCLDPKPFLTQQDVESAEVQRNSKGKPVIFLTFRNEAARRELQITRQNIGNPVAIVLNGKVVFVPIISAASRFLYIDGDFKQDEAVALVTSFNHHSAAR